MSIPLPGITTIVVLVLIFMVLRKIGLGFGALVAWIGDEFLHDWIKQRKSARDRRRRLKF